MDKNLNPKKEILTEFEKLQVRISATYVHNQEIKDLLQKAISKCYKIVDQTPFTEEELLAIEQEKLKKELDRNELPF